MQKCYVYMIISPSGNVLKIGCTDDIPCMIRGHRSIFYGADFKCSLKVIECADRDSALWVKLYYLLEHSTANRENRDFEIQRAIKYFSGKAIAGEYDDKWADCDYVKIYKGCNYKNDN